MIAEVYPTAYDVNGRSVFAPGTRRYRTFGASVPMGRHLTQPLSVTCRTFDDIRHFLSTCEYVSDPVQFGRADYWLPPDEFERRRRGDCEDFALWTWRQVMALGYSARFVCGHAGRYGGGHAWVTFERDGRTFIVESLAARFGLRFPRLSTLRYLPRVSVAWDGAVLRYFEHTPFGEQVSFLDIAPHVPEWVAFWLRSRPRVWSARFRRMQRVSLRNGP